MNPLRQEIRQNSVINKTNQSANPAFPFPLKLSVSTLRTEVSGLEKLQNPVPEIRPASQSPENKTPDFWTAWHSHREYLIRLSMIWMNVSAADAEDAFSDATMRAYEKYKTHAAQISNERAWFARLLHNICIDKHRANKRLKNLYDKVKEISDIDISAMETSQQTPERALLNSELGRTLVRAINDLPERLRTPVVLRLVQGEEYDDIAKALNISNDNVRKRVQQARVLLRESLAAMME